MASRERILNKLKECTAPRSGIKLLSFSDKDLYHDHSGDDSFCRNSDLFVANFTGQYGEVFYADTVAIAGQILLGLLDEQAYPDAFVNPSPLIAEVLPLTPALKPRIREYPDQFLSPGCKALSEYSIGITGADYLIARTGSIVLKCTTTGGRRLAGLPSFHIILSRKSQILPSMEDLFVRLQAGKNDWSHLVMVSGPSRSADIEKVLIIGAHGPQRVALILVDG